MWFSRGCCDWWPQTLSQAEIMNLSTSLECPDASPYRSCLVSLEHCDLHRSQPRPMTYG